MTTPRRTFPYLSQQEALASLEADNPFFTMCGRRSHKTLLYDYEIVPILEKLCGDDLEFFYENNSSLSLEELFDYFAMLMPLGGRPGEPSMLCSPDTKQYQMPIAKALRRCRINLQAKPHGWDAIEGTHYIDPYGLPRTMAFDVDENKKPEFKSLYPHYHGYEIHDALDIAAPLCVTINPVSMNCQYIYEIRYSGDEWIHAESTERRFKRLRKILSWLFGADTNCGGHAMRSPWYLLGMHRANPERKTNSTYRYDVSTFAIFHYSKWYEPHAYTLDEMEAIARYLCELHGVDLENAFDTDGRKIDHRNDTSRRDVHLATDKAITTTVRQRTTTIDSSIANLAAQRALARRPPESILEGERNNYLFACTAVDCHDHAWKFRDKPDSHETMKAWVTTRTLAKNARLPQPLLENEVRATAVSPVKFYLSPHVRTTFTTAQAIAANRKRWGNDHVSIKRIAAAMGVSESTYRRRLDDHDANMIALTTAMVASHSLRKPSAYRSSATSLGSLKYKYTSAIFLSTPPFAFNTTTTTQQHNDMDAVTAESRKAVLNHHHPPDDDADMQLLRRMFAFQEEIERNPRRKDGFFGS